MLWKGNALLIMLQRLLTPENLPDLTASHETSRYYPYQQGTLLSLCIRRFAMSAGGVLWQLECCHMGSPAHQPELYNTRSFHTFPA